MSLLWLKYWLNLTACTWLFLITVFEGSGYNERESYFQILAKNKDIRQDGKAVFLDVRTQEKGKNNSSVMRLMYIYIYIYIYMCTCF